MDKIPHRSFRPPQVDPAAHRSAETRALHAQLISRDVQNEKRICEVLEPISRWHTKTCQRIVRQCIEARPVTENAAITLDNMTVRYLKRIDKDFSDTISFLDINFDEKPLYYENIKNDITK
jgi:hypothetical protein